ncbi:hypothetical protein V6N13_048077 [Hibiscus sabdariffa]
MSPDAIVDFSSKKEPPIPEPPRLQVHSFCKTLIASTRSNYGGFSVLRRHADECLPPLVSVIFRICLVPALFRLCYYDNLVVIVNIQYDI